MNLSPLSRKEIEVSDAVKPHFIMMESKATFLQACDWQ